MLQIDQKKIGKREDKVTLKRIAFAGGGTAGHLYPAIALAQEFQSRFLRCHIQFWGTKKGVEFHVRDQIEFKSKTIRIRGFRRQIVLSNFMIPFELIGSMFYIFFSFLLNRPDLVVGTGGYVSGPVVFTACFLGVKTAIHEQNSYPGATTKFLSKWVKKVYLTYEVSRKYFKDQSKLQVLGNPVRAMRTNIERKDAQKEFGLQYEKKTLFVFGGSQGGLGINKMMLKIAPLLLSGGKNQIIWSTGPTHFERIKEQLGELEGLHLSPFIDTMDVAYMASDLVLCRAGATTIAELTYLGIPAILIPFPFSASGHQVFNAREVESRGAAKCFLEDEISYEQMCSDIKELLANDQQLNEMKNKMQQLSRPYAAHDIVSDLCSSILHC